VKVPLALDRQEAAMGYIDDSLAENESLVYRAHFHWVQKARAWLTLLFFGAVTIGILWMVPDWMGIAGAVATGLIGLGAFVTMMLPLWTTEIGVTSQRFIFKRGWFQRTTDELQLRAIEEVNLEQGALGRVLDYGRLILHGTGVNDIILPALADPVGLRKALQEALGNVDAPTRTSPPLNQRLESGAV
jgi:Bacterial PH domain